MKKLLSFFLFLFCANDICLAQVLSQNWNTNPSFLNDGWKKNPQAWPNLNVQPPVGFARWQWRSSG